MSRGDGRVFLRRGSRWWIAYYVRGKEVREAAVVADNRARGGVRPAKSEREAKKALRATLRALYGGSYMTPQERRSTVDELLDDLVTHLRNRGARSVDKLVSHLKPIREFFGFLRVTEVTTKLAAVYTQERLSLGRAPATVNRELEGLKRAFSFAAKQTPPRVSSVPYVPLLKAENARQGFLNRADFEAVKANIPDADVRDFVEWGFWTGMRKGEIAKLTWDMLDRETWTLRLHARAAKTGKGRALTLAGPVREIIERRDAARRLDCPLIFHRKLKGKLGQPVKEFRKMWNAACRAANINPGRAGLTFHDTRRTAVRNMRKAGIHETVAMSTSGHRTRSMFDRYNIVDGDDQREAFTRLDGYVSSLPTKRKVVGIESGPKADHFPSDAPLRKRQTLRLNELRNRDGGSAWESNPPPPGLTGGRTALKAARVTRPDSLPRKT